MIFFGGSFGIEACDDAMVVLIILFFSPDGIDGHFIILPCHQYRMELTNGFGKNVLPASPPSLGLETLGSNANGASLDGGGTGQYRKEEQSDSYASGVQKKEISVRVRYGPGAGLEEHWLMTGCVFACVWNRRGK